MAVGRPPGVCTLGPCGRFILLKTAVFFSKKLVLSWLITALLQLQRRAHGPRYAFLGVSVRTATETF
jgi:hypothetical protein